MTTDSAEATLGLIVAMTDERVIGRDGDLPWRIKEDLVHFRRTTTGHAIIMGRKTHESIGRPLPKRRNIVMTRDASASFEGCDAVTSFDAALALVPDDSMPMVIGGATIYELALPRATHLFITEVHREVHGDTFFPAFDPDEWTELERRPAESAPDVEFVSLVRRRTNRPRGSR